ncbi:uncharacterized protein PFL1_00111 [Pseudozyma flocculosa PF-1]|uniref:Related to ARO80 - positive transcription regulator of ARO9 and ARO10 n=1 Tax=Pseudozyma flocculosa TaxID=84751 RepID=A0A5C3EUF9_9BASI|nr:uncharacterized protein PFL1_00111 [Pseudozyma flocculosa PF-1]EPQ31912.1 hypothetical protein PFL1_00111 [Pseudozyma flocculosa PF-1]SPO35176.1 related to ARO80 - positive transcription regulator of ARO9 and ARO10 [Pseudozyma flocculosa]
MQASSSTPRGVSTPSRQLGSPDDAATASGKKEFQRSFKACDGCRTKKVKCDLGSLDAPSEPPCSRCKREMRQCLFTMSTRGRGSKTRSTRAQAFGAHHLAKAPTTQSLLDDDLDSSTAAIDALAGAALASLPDANPRLHSTRHDVSVRELDPSDAPSIGMIYGIQGGATRSSAKRSSSSQDARKRVRHSAQPGQLPRRSSSSAAYFSRSESEDSSGERSDAGGAATAPPQVGTAVVDDAHVRENATEPDPLQQYASVGLQHSRDALRVLAGVAAETRDSTASRSTSIGESVEQIGASAMLQDVAASASPDKEAASPRHGHPSPALSASSKPPPSKRARDAGGPALGRPNTPPPLKHRYGWSKFEPIRLKLIKRSEAKHFLNFFLRRMHSFAPHCSPHLLDKSTDALSELVSREPILLGAMLSVASRYDVANHNAHLIHPDTFHRKISKWTQEKISRSFFLPGSHTIGTIEALLILSEWATLDLHDRRTSEEASSESEDDPDGDDDDFADPEMAMGEAALAADGASPAAMPTPGPAASATAPPNSSNNWLRRLSSKSLQRPARLDLRESEKFDDTAWMLTGTALRLAERLDLQNVSTYSGISSAESASRLNAERRMRVWMSSVHADCHLSVRLGRRISSPGLMAPFMNLVRDRTHPFLIRSDASSSIGLSDTSLATGTPRAWIAFRAHAELLQIVFRTCENLYRSRAVTERLLEDEDFVPALKSIRDDLDEWANWTQPRIEPIRDMTSLRLRVEYHYARLYANGVSLDSLKRGLGTFRPNNRVQYHSGATRRDGTASGGGSLGLMEIGLSTHPAYPFVREALAAAQSLIRILTVELDSMMCAPARWFLLLVMAAVFCVKATAVSDTILPLNRCAQSLQQVITALTKAAPDGVHLANRYSMYLRRLAKQLILTDAKARRKTSAAAARSRHQDGPPPPKGTRIEMGLEEGQCFNYKVFNGEHWNHHIGVKGGAEAAMHMCGPGRDCATDVYQNERAQTSATVASSRARTLGAHASPASESTPPASHPGHSSTNAGSGPRHSAVAGAASSPAGQSQSGAGGGFGGGGTWWSTGDVLGGEMDPDSFLRWLDEQTMASTASAGSSTAAAVQAGWPASSSAGVGSTTAAAAFPLHASATSPFAPHSSSSLHNLAPANGGGATSGSLQSAFGTSGGSMMPSSAGGGGASNIGGAPTVTAAAPSLPLHSGPTPDAYASTPGTEQDDLLTRMWLDDALTDLASSGLDMPFL